MTREPENVRDATTRANDGERFQNIRMADDSTFHNFMNKRDLAISWILDYLPEVDEATELDELVIEPNEFNGANLSRWTADAVYSIPFKRSRNHMKLGLVLEHKSRLPYRERRVALAQTATYLCNLCLLEAKRAKANVVIPQPFATVVYTGRNTSLQKLTWEEEFPHPKELQQWGMKFDLNVVNMTKRLAEGKKPENFWLEIMYSVMTRPNGKAMDGFEHEAFLPLLRHSGAWTSTDSERVVALTTLYSAHIHKSKLDRHNERIATLFNSVDLENKMVTESLYNMFAPAAEQFGITKGVEIGRDQGIKIGRDQGIKIGRGEGIEIGRDQERDATLDAQRKELCSAIRARFGSCPNAVRDALKRIVDVTALLQLQTFALLQARSVGDVLERAKNAIR